MSDSNKLAPNLHALTNLLDKHKLLIATKWVKVSSVRAVFHAKKISIKKFRDGYGIPIIEYFISVVQEKKDAGNCPIMSRLVHYLLSKDITPREVFDICMGFREILMLFLLKEENIAKNPIPYVKEVTKIFDANLSGVLDIFTELYANAQKKIESAKLQRTKLQQTLKIINYVNIKILIVQNGRIILANEPFLKMLGVENLKELYAKHKKGFEFLSDVDTFENDFKLNISNWIRKVCKNNKPFQCKIYNEEMKKKYNYSGRITYMPEDDSGQYIITLSNISDHIKDEEALEDMLLHDELTGFRNYPTFEKLIGIKIEEVKKDNARLFLAVADIPNLREINENEGREKGDSVISELAEDLRFLVDSCIYLGRLEGSRFGILLQYPTEQAAYDWCISLYKKMSEREHRKTLAISEVDLSESVNKLFLRVYDLIEKSNNSEDNIVVNDFNDVIEYRELPNQLEFIERLSKYKSIKLSMFYMELALTSNVKIVATTQDSISIELSSKQAKISKIESPVYFRLENIGNIKAYIKDINKSNRVAIIDRFRFDKHTPLNREMFRIKVTDDIRAYVEENNREYSVKVLDMNYEYISIAIDRKRNFDINSLLLIDMLLPIGETSKSCVFNATITRIEKIVGGYKMVLLLNGDDDSRKLLTEYIAKAQMNIIHNFSI